MRAGATGARASLRMVVTVLNRAGARVGAKKWRGWGGVAWRLSQVKSAGEKSPDKTRRDSAEMIK